MITKDKIEIYRKYNGDIDGWARASLRSEIDLLTDEDWSLIENIIQDIELAEKGTTSSDFQTKLQMRIKKYCENEEVERLLKSQINDKRNR